MKVSNLLKVKKVFAALKESKAVPLTHQWAKGTDPNGRWLSLSYSFLIYYYMPVVQSNSGCSSRIASRAKAPGTANRQEGVILPTGKYSVDCIIGRGMRQQSSLLCGGGCFFQAVWVLTPLWSLHQVLSMDCPVYIVWDIRHILKRLQKSWPYRHTFGPSCER